MRRVRRSLLGAALPGVHPAEQEVARSGSASRPSLPVGVPVTSNTPTERYRQALAEIETLAFRQYVDWMHFHELAMARPFDAENEAQDFARRVSSLATIALGEHSGIEVVGE